MKTVDKAMRLLGLFSTEAPELGLTEIARMASIDKAVARRLLLALAEHGLIEQVSESRKYRLGSGLLHLARVREASVPVADLARQTVDWLFDQCGQTTHISVPANGGLCTIAHRVPERGAVVTINPADLLPMHATASGIAYLGFLSAQQRALALAAPLQKFARNTPDDVEQILQLAQRAGETGYASCASTFEDDVCSVAAPFFDHRQQLAGTVAMARPGQSVEASGVCDLLGPLFSASEKLTTLLGGVQHTVLANASQQYAHVA